jgi:glycosyltransferase involved in cell wall biosynthesis
MTVGLLLRLLTQVLQRRTVRRLVRERGIDVVHQPIPVSPKEPSLMFGLGVPVVIGPMNGGMEFPPAFRNLESGWVRGLVNAGRSLAHLAHVLFPGKRQAAALLVANARTGQALPRGHARNVITFIENGVDLAVWSPKPVPPRADAAVTRFIFVGRLVDWKGVDMLLEAFQRAASSDAMLLQVIGDGPERGRLEAMATAMGLTTPGEGMPGTVSFLGWRSQPECAELLWAADAMVLPSVWECGGAVVLEAMSVGIPVIATDWGGPADYLDAQCGILVRPETRQAFIDGLASSMLRLAASPELRAAMGAAGRRKVLDEFDWEVKVDRMISVYRSVLRAPAESAVAMAR